MALRGRRRRAPQQPQASAAVALSATGKKMGQEPGETCPQPARPCTGVLAGLGCTGLQRPSPMARDAPRRRLGLAGSSPGLWGCDPNPPLLWDNLGPRHRTAFPRSPAPISGSDTGAARGVDRLSGWGIAAPAPLFAIGLISLRVCALRTGSGSRGPRGG